MHTFKQFRKLLRQTEMFKSISVTTYLCINFRDMLLFEFLGDFYQTQKSYDTMKLICSNIHVFQIESKYIDEISIIMHNENDLIVI